ncbi:MAG: nucleotide exchange factor GrpE [Deltaproteobacteria bacterium]|nr:nucleotide exchange factor GrpE [Deltaproteobacteria bacterium]
MGDRSNNQNGAPTGQGPGATGEQGPEGLGFRVLDRRHWVDTDDAESSEAPRADVPTYVQQLEAQLREKDEKLREYIAAYKSEVAGELQQTRERLERDALQRQAQIRQELILPMLEVFETLEMAISAARSGGDKASILAGVERVSQLMVTKFQEMGVERVPTVGQRFDPTQHEAVALMPVTDPDQDKCVIAEFSPGFSCEGRVFRPAKVQVGQLQS